MLHRVLPDLSACYDPEMAVSTARFAEFLDWLAADYEVVPLAQLQARLRQQRTRARPLCALTFDDGWLDTYTEAFPLWRRHQFPVTVFLPTAFVGTARRFWQERLWLGLRQAGGSAGERLAAACAQCDWCPPLRAAHGNARSLRNLLTQRSSPEAEAFVAAFCAGLPPPDGRAFMNWDEARALQQAGVSIGSHTVEHTLLNRSLQADAARELHDSRKHIQDQLGGEVAEFCYPWGGLNPLIHELVREAGYRWAVTTRPGLARATTDTWLLPRIAVSEGQLGGADRAAWTPSLLQLRLGRARFHLAPALAPRN